MTGHLLLVVSLLFISGGESGNVSPRRRSPQGSGGGGGSGGGTQVDFDCPEEFGYYAHPSDCTQYYVCVFGGALLESCTGGLMYSHELQTCDWPRNVGCAPGTTASQQVQQIQPETRQRQSSIQQQPQQRERITQQQIPKHDLYTEDEQLGVEELDADRQQRVYRGQPQAIGQVQSDRDALSTHSNAIPIPGRDKLSVVSYGTQQQYTSSTRQKPTGDVIQDKSDHNFLTNVTIVRRVKRQSLLRSQDGRLDSYDSSPISWSSFQPRIVHHRRPQLLPSMYPSPQPPPPHARPTHNHQVNLRPRPYHRRPNEYKYDSPDMKLTKHTSASSTLKPSPVDPSSTFKPNLRPQPVNPSYSPPDEANYYHTSSKQSTFRPSFGPPAYQQNHPSQIKHYQTQRPREREPTTHRPPTSYRSQVTKPPLEYPSSSTLRTFTERKPTSYVYASNNMHKESGLQLNHQPHTSEKVEDEGGGGSSSDPSDDEEEYEDDDEDEEEEDGTNEEQDRTKEEESREKNKSNENASVSKNSNENTFRPKFPDPPSGFYKDISSASVSSDEKNPFASPDFDFDKFLDELRDHPPAYTTPKSYFESASSSKESFPGNNYYYPKGTTPKYHSSVKDSIHKYPPHKEQTPKYVPANSYKPAGYYQSSKDSPYKSNYHTGETSPKYSSTYSSYPKESNKYGYQTLKQGPAMYYKPSSSAEQTTSKYFYSTLKENFNKYGNSNYSSPVQTTPITYDGFYPSKPYYGQTPSYQNNQHHGVVKSTTNSPFRISHPSLTTDRPMPVRHHQYYDDYVGGRGKNSSYVRQPKPPLAPMEPTRLQNIDSDSPEDEEEYSDENGEYEYDDDEEEGSEDEEDSNEDEYEDEEDEGSSNNEDASVTQERPESNESLRPRKPNPPASSSEYPTSTIKYTQNPKYFENSTPKQPNKPHFDRGRCSTIRGRTRCADYPSSTSTTALDQQLSLLYSTSTTFRPEDHQSNEYSSNEPTSQRPAGRLRMRRPTSPLPSPSPSTSATLSAPAHVFTSTYGTNSSRQTPMLLSPSYPKASTEPVSVAAVKPKQRQNRNKPVLSEETDMGDKGQTLRALTQMRASVTPSQQQYVQQQTTQQQQTTPPRAYNQSRYQSQYEPQFYSLYDEDVDLYKEIGDYSQYNGQSNNNQYRNQKKPQIEIVQQEPARGSTYSKNKYNSQSDIYQSVTPQDYESYSIQSNDDLGYQTQQQTKNTIRSEVKETDGRYRSLVSTASPQSESKATSQRTDQQEQQQQTDSTTPKLVTTPLPEGPNNPQKTNDSPAPLKIGTVVNTPSPFKLPDTKDDQPVNLLTRGHFIVREPELVTQLVVDITPKPNRNRAESPVQQRTISIRVPQAAIDSNKFTAQDEPKPRPTPIRASESAEWNGFRVGNNAEVRSNHQDLDQDINRRPSQRVADSIKIREEYLRQREEASRGTESQSSRTRVPGRKVPETTGRGSSRYQDTPYEQGQYADSQNAQPTPLTGEQPRLQVTQSPPFVDEGQKYRADVEEQQKYVQAADRNARIQAQLRALGNRDSVGREAGPDSRRQEELKRKAYEEARARQIDEAEREAREQVRLRQFEEARRKQVEEAERVAKELSERKEREEAQRRAAILEMRRKQVEEAERKANEEARIKAMEEEARRRAEEEALRERQILEARRAKEEAERKQAIEEAQRRAAVEEARRAAIEEARRKAAIEEAERRRAIEEAARRQAIEEAQRRAAVDEARRKAALEEAAREEALKKAKIEEEEEAKQKAADESRRRYLENQRQLEENLSRRRLPARPVEQDTSLTYNSKPSYEATERYKPTSRGSSGFRIVVDSTEPPRGFTVTRPPKKYVSRNSTLINELYLNEQSTTLSNDERTNSVTPNSLLQTSPGRTYTENARKTLDTPIPISKSDPDYTDKTVRVRPTSYETQSTPGLTRGNNRHRGSQSYTLSPNDAEPAPQPNRGTPAAPRVRPTLKPSTTVVGKASEYLDIFRYPARRPDNVYPTPQPDKTAAKCRKDVCLLPDCSCGGKDIPGDLPLEETPQIVLLTFDDSVNDLNKGLYEDLFERGRVNPNGCPISATFYVSHEWTDYGQVQNLYATGHEIASHSVSHSFGEQFSQKKWTKEIAGQREILAAYGGVRLEDIRGMRAPFLAVGGNKMFKMLHDSNFTYDSSMPVYENKPPSWPYTMDYKIFHDCMIPPCPTKSYPGVWEVPMVMWQDLNGGRCSMGDACSNPPTAEGVYKMLIKNFERHFTTNRAPFGLFYHAAWFTQPHHKEGFIAFLDTINKMPEVWLVTNWQAIQWVRDPTPIPRVNNFAPFSCDYPERPKKCNNPKVCNLWHKSGVRYMRTCQPCPDVYPWTGKSGIRNSRVDNEIINE